MYWFIEAILLICTVLAYKCEGGFIITAPTTFLEETIEHVCVSLHNISSPVTVDITFLPINFEENIFSLSHNITNDNITCLEVYMPPTDLSVARLVAHVKSGNEISENIEHMVTVQRKQLINIIVTDKPMYKPGQEVKFRVLVLSHNLQPYLNVWRIWIEDPSLTRRIQWDDLMTSHGLVDLTYILAKNSIKGIWNICVQQKNSVIEAKQFKVLEYVAPTFEVIIHPPSRITADTKLITWKICGKYSYGRAVKGHLYLQVKLMKKSKILPPEINDSAQLNEDSGCFVFSLTRSDLSSLHKREVPDTVVLNATVVEQGTKILHYSTVTSKFVNTEFFLEFQCSRYFKPGLPYKGKVILKTEDGGEVGAGKKIQICIKVLYKTSSSMSLQGCWSYTSDLGSQVVFTLPFLYHSQNVQMIMLMATAPEHPTKQHMNSSEILMIEPSTSQTVRPWFSPSRSYIDAATRSPIHCSSTHMIPVRYTVVNKYEPTPVFYYMVKSRGDLLFLRSIIPKNEILLQHNNVESDDNIFVRSWRLPLHIDPQMSPHSKLTLYYVRNDGEVVATTTPLVVEPCFPNKVHAHWSASQTFPGSKVSFRVRAYPQSLCALSVIDHSILFNSQVLPKTEEEVWLHLEHFDNTTETKFTQEYCRNDEEEDDTIWSKKERYKRFLFQQENSYYTDAISAFYDLGVVVMSNLVLQTRPCKNKKELNILAGGSQRCLNCSGVGNYEFSNYLIKQNGKDNKNTLRYFFPDTWIWDLVHIGRQGEVKVEAQVPDSLTTWQSNVFCLSDREGFGIASAPPLVSFLPFFVQLDVPYSLKKNERVQIKISVYNYINYDLPVRLDLRSEDGLLILDNFTSHMCVHVKSLAVQIINVKAVKLGIFNITATASVIPRFAGCETMPDVHASTDVVMKTVLVKSEGFLITRTKTAFMCPEENNDSVVSWDLHLPDNIVEGSVKASVSVVSDLLGPALQNLESLVELPTGCGEQNLVLLASNIYILRYIDSVGLYEHSLRKKALNNIYKGYQRQLNFRHNSGGFSPFGNKDLTPSMWLTAFVVKILEEASDLIYIDANVVKDSKQWMIETQMENGCFPSIGQVFHSSMQENASDESTTVALTSMVLLSLSASRHAVIPTSVITNAKFCLTAGIMSVDPYSLALTALALTKLNFTDQAALAIQRLMDLSQNDDYFLYWKKNDESLALSTETTSYAILSILAVGGDDRILLARKAVKWILQNLNSKGGFVTSLDTVVSLEALVKYTLSLPLGQNTDLTVLVTGDGTEMSFRIKNDNKLVLQKYELPSVIPHLQVEVIGEGCTIVQNTLTYNVDRIDGSDIFDVIVSSHPMPTKDDCSLQVLHVCVRYKLANGSPNMAILNIMFVSGFKPLKSSPILGNNNDNLENSKVIRMWELEDDQIVFYLSNITSQKLCIDVVMEQLLVVEDSLPASITLTDYYYTERSSTKMYNLKCDQSSKDLSPLSFQESPIMNDDSFSNFHNVDHELETPDGIEGPRPVYALPPEKTNHTKL